MITAKQAKEKQEKINFIEEELNFINGIILDSIKLNRKFAFWCPCYVASEEYNIQNVISNLEILGYCVKKDTIFYKIYWK